MQILQEKDVLTCRITCKKRGLHAKIIHRSRLETQNSKLMQDIEDEKDGWTCRFVTKKTS